MSLFNTAHLNVCGCPSCTGQSAQQSGNNLFNAKTVNAEHLAVSGSVEGYARAVTGNDAKLWVAGAAGTETFGQGITLKYTYANGVSWANYAGNSGGTTYTAVRQTAMNESMQMYSDVSGVKFELGTAANANIAFKSYNLSGAAGVAYVRAYNTGKIDSVETVLANAPSAYGASSDAQAFAKGGYGYVCAIHELGHSLGLKHTGNYNAGGGGAAGPYLSDFGIADNRDASVMSYSDGVVADATHRPTGLMFADIVAIQQLYGANTTYNAGATTYTLDTNSGVKAIWDGGGAGDTLNASAQTAAVTLDLREGINNWTRVGESRLQMAKGANIENATGGSGADTITGNSLANVLTGGGGNDSLTGGAGNDTLVGGAGTDVYTITASGDGTDVITDSDGLGSIVLGGATVAGTATVSGSGYTLSVGGATYNLALSGTTLSITKSGGTSVAQIENFTSGNFGITLSGTATGGGSGGGSGGGGSSGGSSGGGSSGGGSSGGGSSGGTTSSGNINGTSGNDVITGTAAAECIYGLAGDDTINTLKTGGIDTIDGGSGNDTITIGGVGGSVSGGTGDDVITSKATEGTVTLNGDAGADKITGSAIATTFNGGEGNDVIKGGAGNDTVNGDAGDDSVDSGAGNDSINGGEGADAIKGAAGNDVINGDAGNDTIDGGANADTINGGAGNDSILGGADADSITGGAGADIINGGADVDTIILGNDGAADILVFSSAKELGDTITGFDKGVDKVQLSGSLAGTFDDLNGAMDGVFSFSTGNVANFNTAHEGWIVSGSASLTDLASVANVFNAAGTITAAKGADGLLVLNNGSTTGVYQYIEKGGTGNAVNHIDVGDLTFLGTIGQNGALTSVDFSFATI